MTTCPNCKIELAKISEEKFECPKCIYSYSKPKRVQSKGSQSVQQANRIIKDLLVEAKLSDEPFVWIKNWTQHPTRNYDSNTHYKGFFNRIVTGLQDEISYITKKSIEKKKLSLKEGATTTHIMCWVPPKLRKDEKKLSEVEQKKLMKKRFPIMVLHEVYKAKDVDGLPKKSYENDKVNKRFTDIEKFIKSTKVEIREGGNRPTYSNQYDRITIPRIEQHENSEEYYKNILHELAHASRHKNRLNRDEKKFKADQNYGREELIAEFSCAYMCNYFGIEPDKNTVAYIDGWLKAIEGDSYLLVSASQQAEKVLKYFGLV